MTSAPSVMAAAAHGITIAAPCGQICGKGLLWFRLDVWRDSFQGILSGMAPRQRLKGSETARPCTPQVGGEGAESFVYVCA
jgi:hypothetical protein